MKATFIYSFIIIVFSLQFCRSQEKTFDNFINQNFNDFDANKIKKDWIEPPPKNSTLPDSFQLVRFTDTLKGILCELKIEKDENNNIRQLYLNFGSPYFETCDYEYWKKVGSLVYTNLLKSFGKPLEFNIHSELDIDVKWKKNGYFINFLSAFRKTKIRSGYCILSFSKEPPRINYYKQYFINDETLQTYKNSFYENISELKPGNKESVNTALNGINNYKDKNHLSAENQRVFSTSNFPVYKKVINPFELILTRNVYTYALEEKPQNNKTSLYWIYERGKLKEFGNVKIHNNFKVNTFKVKYHYGETGLLEFINYKDDESSNNFWLEYDQNCYLSRITYFENNMFLGTYLVFAENKYDCCLIAYYDSTNQLKHAEIKLNQFHFKHIGWNRELQSSQDGNTLNDEEDFFVKDFNLNTSLPHLNTDLRAKINKPYNTFFLKKEINNFESFGKSINEYHKWYKQLMIKEQLNPTLLFKEYSSNIAHIDKPSKFFFPIAVTQVGHDFVKVIDQNKKVSVIKQNQILLKRFQLTSISNNLIKFKKISNGKIYNLIPRKVLPLESACQITLAGFRHVVENGENFFGKKVSFNEENAVLIDNKLLDSKWHFFPHNIGVQSDHSIINCGCNTKVNKKLELDIEEEKRFQNFDKSLKPSYKSLKFFIDNCFIQLVQSKEVSFNQNITTNTEVVGVYKFEDNQLSYKKEEFSNNKNYSLKIIGENIFVNGRKVYNLVPKSLNGMYGIKVNSKTYISLKFIPRNMKALILLLDHCNLESFEKKPGWKTYVLSRQKVSYLQDRKSISEQFTFKLDPLNREFIINALKYKINFNEFNTTLSSPNSETLIFQTRDKFHSIFYRK